MRARGAASGARTGRGAPERHTGLRFAAPTRRTRFGGELERVAEARLPPLSFRRKLDAEHVCSVDGLEAHRVGVVPLARGDEASALERPQRRTARSRGRRRRGCGVGSRACAPRRRRRGARKLASFPRTRPRSAKRGSRVRGRLGAGREPRRRRARRSRGRARCGSRPVRRRWRSLRCFPHALQAQASFSRRVAGRRERAVEVARRGLVRLPPGAAGRADHRREANARNGVRPVCGSVREEAGHQQAELVAA